MLHQDTRYPIALADYKDEVHPNAADIAMMSKMPSGEAAYAAKKSASLYQRVGDLDSFGKLSASEKFLVTDYIKQGRFAEAEAIISEKEGKLSTGKRQIYWMDVVNKYLPVGYKLNDQKISGVPNYVVYTGLGVATLFLLKSMRKKR